MYYKPKLANGKYVQLPLMLSIYRWVNIVCWPIEDNSSQLAKILDRIHYLLVFLNVIFHVDAEIRYLYRNFHNIDEMLTGMPTFLILLEAFLRCHQLGFKKEKLKAFLKQFYAEIYIEESERPQQYHRIQRKLRPTSVISVLFVSTLGLYFVPATLNLILNHREPIFKMIFSFDHTPLYIFYPILLANIWLGFYVLSFVIGELNMLSQILLHLNGRFLLLGDDLGIGAERLLKEADAANIAYEYQLEVKRIIKKNVELYKFSAKVQAEFTYRIFVWFAFSAIFLCALLFKVYTNPREGYIFVGWSIGKILELTTIGLIGSTVFETTYDLSSMYYHSKWELIIERSSNTRENIRLMKLILIAMETSQKPIILTGLNFFGVSLNSVLRILQGAGSYFTCLISIR